MTGLAWSAFAAAGLCALFDWVGVARSNKQLEYIFKPATIASLVAAALAVEGVEENVRVAFVIALCLGLVGDVFLMLPTDRFVAGLAAFLAGHVAYIVGLRFDAASGLSWTVVTFVLIVAGAPLALRIVRGAVARRASLGPPVAAYTGVITLMVSAALVSGQPLAIAGALLFYLSDTLIGWSRFVRAPAWAPVAIIVTYHLGQGLLVASLATA